MTGPITATVSINGARVADTAAEFAAGAPTVLTDAQVTWGRKTVVDQPDTSTCSCTIIRKAAGAGAFLNGLTIGAPLRLTTAGTTYPNPTVSTFLDPGFANPTAPYVPLNATGTTVAGVFRMLPVNAAAPAGVILAPAPFVAHGGNPAAWDAIPATSRGQRWGFGLDVTAPAGATVRVRPVVFTGPWADAYTIRPEILVVVGDGAVHTVSGSFLPDVDGAWVGLEVVADPTGKAWNEVSPTLTWNAVPPTTTWDDYGLVKLDNVRVLAPAAGTVRTVLVFAGRITDLAATFDDGLPGGGGVRLDVTAADFTADLENNRIGDVPWAVQTLGTRVSRILTLAATGVTATVDATVASTLVTYRDVDSQPASGLMKELAISVDGVLWSAVHQTTGPYYRLEDPAQRPSLQLLTLTGGIITITPNPLPAALRLSSCEVLRDPAQWSKDVSDVSTRVDVTWQEQGVDGGGKVTTTERHTVVIDTAREAVVGQRGVSVATQLQAQADAALVAGRWMSRISAQRWRLDGLVWDTRISALDPALVGTALDLLDGTTRIARTLVLTEVPAWSPNGPDIPLYVEGGEWSFSDGWWVFNLTTSSSSGGNGLSAAWNDLNPAWTWNQWDPALTWDQLRGVGTHT
jgi:hypothetical protein